MHPMMSKPQPAGKRASQLQSMIITAITLFALSGLMVGFAFGTFMRPAKPQQSTAPAPRQTSATSVSIKQPSAPSPTATPTPTPQITGLGCPALIISPSQTVDFNTPYTLTVQVKDKTKFDPNKCDPKAENNITADGVTCRIWLTKETKIADSNEDTKNILSDPTNLPDQFPHEISDSLKFDATTPQVQQCTQGTATWKYQFSPTLDKGTTYYIMVVTDYKGTYYAWSSLSAVVPGK